ncbi:MAG: SAM hydrolase/SAM-dependent halogenase family protein, partial [Gammaproteobacteria bacterium]
MKGGGEKRLIVLFTDFGGGGPYVGLMESVIRRLSPDAGIVNLVSNAPKGNPRSSSYLLAALRRDFPENSVFLCVVDPGVGGDRRPVVLVADGQRFVGPENGLLNTAALQSFRTAWHEIAWRPGDCSPSFHGRDIFAPVAAELASGNGEAKLAPIDRPESLAAWPADLPEIVYFDHYGNAMTGLRFRPEMSGAVLAVADTLLPQADTFCR